MSWLEVGRRRMGEVVRRHERRGGRQEWREAFDALLPDAATLDRLTRDEAHVGRQLLQAQHVLERLQKDRAGPDGPADAAFHALRHSFIALLCRSGATLKEAMQLARHWRSGAGR